VKSIMHVVGDRVNMNKTIILLKHQNGGRVDDFGRALMARGKDVTIVCAKDDIVLSGTCSRYRWCDDIFNVQSVAAIIRELSEDNVIEDILSPSGVLSYVSYYALKEFLPSHERLSWLLKTKIKPECRKILYENGLSASKCYVIREIEDVHEASKNLKYPLVFKPIGAQGSLHVYKVETVEELEERYAEFVRSSLSVVNPEVYVKLECGDCSYNLNADAFVEEYISGDEYTVDGYVVDGAAVVVAVQQKIFSIENEGGFRDVFYMTEPMSWDALKNRAVVCYVDKVVALLGIDSTPFHIEIRINGSRIDLIEVNAKVGGGMVAENVIASTGMSLVDVYADIVCGLTVPVEPPCQIKIAYGIGVLIEGEGVVRSIEGLDEIKKIAGVECLKQNVSIGETVDASGEFYALLFSGTVESHEKAVDIYHYANSVLHVALG